MSAYVCNNKTISVLAKAFVDYEVDFNAEGFVMPSLGGIIFNVEDMYQAVGQRLLEQNQASVNYRYDEDTPTPEFEFDDVEINEGTVLGCLKCYSYQACETEGYDDTLLYKSLLKLKDKLLDRLISRSGYDVPWGIE